VGIIKNKSQNKNLERRWIESLYTLKTYQLDHIITSKEAFIKGGKEDFLILLSNTRTMPQKV